MTTYDARPSAFTPISTTADWEKLCYSMGLWDGIDSVTSLAPSLPGGRTYQIGAGSVFIKGQLWYMDTAFQGPVPTQTVDRIDMLVIQYDRNAQDSASVIQPAVITKGNLTVPVPTQTPDGIYEIPVCRWTAHANGTVDLLVDMRQFCGTSIVGMMSGNRPTPPRNRLGIEVDTGYLLRWDGSSWRNVGPSKQVTATPVTTTTGSLVNLASFTIPANDVNLSANPVAYRIHAGGHGKQGVADTNMTWQAAAYNNAWGVVVTKGNIPVNIQFDWTYDAELIVQANGAATLYGKMIFSRSDASWDQVQSSIAFADTQPAGKIQVTAQAALQIQFKWNNPPGGQTITCYGATFERIAN